MAEDISPRHGIDGRQYNWDQWEQVVEAMAKLKHEYGAMQDARHLKE